MDPGSGGGEQLVSDVASHSQLFATALNCRLLVYFSSLNDPMAVGTGAFLQLWYGLQVYALKPFTLIRQVLNKLRTYKGTLLTLIAPFWPQKEWFPELLSLSVAPPVPLPLRRDLLKQPHFHCLHHSLHMLHLHVWRLCSDLLATYLMLRHLFRLGILIFYNSFVVIFSLVFHSSFMQCYPFRFQLSCEKSVKDRFIEFFVFDYGSLPPLLSLFFSSGVTFSLVALDKITLLIKLSKC